MGYITDGLTLRAFRDANKHRLPEFRNKHGDYAHSLLDGSDWSPAQWFQAVIGELGELAALRVVFDEGGMPFEEYEAKVKKEIADVLTYLDLFALRALDRDEGPRIPAHSLMKVIATLGSWANERKKYERMDTHARDYNALTTEMLRNGVKFFHELFNFVYEIPRSAKTVPHPTGIDLGRATIEKFNEVSERVSAHTRLREDGSDWFYEGGRPERTPTTE